MGSYINAKKQHVDEDYRGRAKVQVRKRVAQPKI